MITLEQAHPHCEDCHHAFPAQMTASMDTTNTHLTVISVFCTQPQDTPEVTPIPANTLSCERFIQRELPMVLSPDIMGNKFIPNIPYQSAPLNQTVLPTQNELAESIGIPANFINPLNPILKK